MKREIQSILYKIVDSPLSKQEKIHMLVSELAPYIKYLTSLRDDLVEEEQDFRGGWDTYGYESIDSIYNNLEYISDRWCAAFRVNWLLGLIHPEDWMHKEQWLEIGYYKTLGLGKKESVK